MQPRDLNLQTWVRRCHLAGALITFALLTAVYTVADGHLDKTASHLNSELHRNQTLVLQRPAVDARTDELRSSITSVEEQLQARRIRIPDTPSEHQFSEHLNGLAQESGLSVDELRPDQYFHSVNMDRMTFRIRLSGEWTGLCEFLQQVTTLERLCHVDQCRVSSETGSPSRLQCELEVSIFCRAPAPTASREKTTL